MKEIYISPNGRDEAAGSRQEPLATLAGAEAAVRGLRANGVQGEIRCVLEAGDYFLEKPWKITPAWNGVTITSEQAGAACLTSEREIKGFEPCKVNGVSAFRAYIPEVAEGTWYFRSLFVNGESRPRTRLPEEGYYWIEDVPGINYEAALYDSSSAFRYHDGDLHHFVNSYDTEIVVLHYWIEERFPILAVEESKRMVHLGRSSTFSLKDDFKPRFAKYYVENAREALKYPGQWYLDRAEGMLYYIPRANEEMETIRITAPCSYQLIEIEGDILQDRHVENFALEGIRFRGTDWFCPVNTELGRGIGLPFASSPQAASNIAGVVSLYGAKDCRIEGCCFEKLGMYGVDIADGCRRISVVRNEFSGLGGGGIKVNGAAIDGREEFRTRENVLSFNHIAGCGNVYYSAAGILIRHSSDNQICNNHIHDLYYSGISVGWTWGFAPNVTYHNEICRNLIHDLGKGVLSDMGGVYLLGIQPRTVVRNNVIYNIEASNYGGWALYTDEGTTGVTLEDNICYQTSSHVFHQHFGRENIVRNNILCFGGEGVVAFPRGDQLVYPEGSDHFNQYTFTGNIVVTNGGKAFHNKYGDTYGRFISDRNLFFDLAGGSALAEWLEEWQKDGYDQHSVILDPGFRDLANGDFHLAEDSPAVRWGFTPISTENVGLCEE